MNSIIKKLADKSKDMVNAPAVTVAFIGDSVTQGCFEVYRDGEESVETVYDQNSAFSNRFKEIIHLLFPNAQLNVINSGISGDNAESGAKRLERDVLRFKPDLTVVSFGLNDSVEGGEKGLPAYLDSLRKIFTDLKKSGSEVVFITQNYMCTEVSPHISDDFIKHVAKIMIDTQAPGTLDKYFEEAKKVCESENVKVLDLRKVWKTMYESGVNVTELLANKINHPIREYHLFVAMELVKLLFGL